MRRKIIIIAIAYTLINIIGCHPTDIFLNTKILSFNLFHGLYNTNSAIMTNDETISSKRYCLILKLKYCDSTVSKATLDKKSASISLINSCYAAYDPPITPHYQLIDSLISFSIISTNNFSNEMKQGDTINNLFNVFYSEANDSKNDSIGYLTMLSQKHLYLTINSTLKQKEGHYTYPYLNIVFTPKIEIRSDNLQIKIIAKFNSGRIVIDSTKAIKIN